MKIRMEALKASCYSFASESVIPRLPQVSQYLGMLLLPRLLDAKLAELSGVLQAAGLLEADGLDASFLLSRLDEIPMDRFEVALGGQRLVFTKEHVRDLLNRSADLSAELERKERESQQQQQQQQTGGQG